MTRDPRLPEAGASPADVVAAECGGLFVLCDLLRAEQEALRAADAALVADLARRKGEEIAVVDLRTRAREAAMRARGFPVSALGLVLWLGEHLGAGEAAARRDALLALADEARRLNGQNGALIARLQRHVDGAFASIASAAGADVLYDPRGFARACAPVRSIETRRGLSA
ncbi:MAG: flagellar protein FlgN [Burkholderiales bacterium]|nr:flagellar protein FlgN [Burkholderiales bacterium]